MKVVLEQLVSRIDRLELQFAGFTVISLSLFSDHVVLIVLNQIFIHFRHLFIILTLPQKFIKISGFLYAHITIFFPWRFFSNAVRQSAGQLRRWGSGGDWRVEDSAHFFRFQF